MATRAMRDTLRGIPTLGGASAAGTASFGIKDFVGDLIRRGAEELVDRGVDRLTGGVDCGPGAVWDFVNQRCVSRSGLVAGAKKCPEGTREIFGECVDIEFGGPTTGQGIFVEPLVNGRGGDAIMGVFGAPAVRPGSEAVRTLTCPRGLVLGKDDLCYAKGSIPNKHRKWPKRPRPKVSAFDEKMMRKYGPGGSKQKSIKRLATNAGFSCKKK